MEFQILYMEGKRRVKRGSFRLSAVRPLLQYDFPGLLSVPTAPSASRLAGCRAWSGGAEDPGKAPLVAPSTLTLSCVRLPQARGLSLVTEASRERLQCWGPPRGCILVGETVALGRASLDGGRG